MSSSSPSRREWFLDRIRRKESRKRERSDRHSQRPDRHSRPLTVEQVEQRTMLSTIVWTNRGDAGDNFDALFGAGAPAQSARAAVDAAIDAWNRVVVNFNHAAGVTGPNGYDLELTISMNAPGANTGCGASTSTTIGADGKPIEGSQNFGNCGGDGSGWFIDPTPNDNSEFAGAINNAFTGTAQAGSPAAGLSDL